MQKKFEVLEQCLVTTLNCLSYLLLLGASALVRVYGRWTCCQSLSCPARCSAQMGWVLSALSDTASALGEDKRLSLVWTKCLADPKYPNHVFLGDTVHHQSLLISGSSDSQACLVFTHMTEILSAFRICRWVTRYLLPFSPFPDCYQIKSNVNQKGKRRDWWKNLILSTDPLGFPSYKGM